MKLRSTRQGGYCLTDNYTEKNVSKKFKTYSEEDSQQAGDNMTILTTPEAIAFIAAGVLLSASGFAMGRLSKK